MDKNIEFTLSLLHFLMYIASVWISVEKLSQDKREALEKLKPIIREVKTEDERRTRNAIALDNLPFLSSILAHSQI